MKKKGGLLDEFTRQTGYHRKSAVRLLSEKPDREVLVSTDGRTVKFKPEKKRPANRKGKRVYSDEVIASLRLIWAFFMNRKGAFRNRKGAFMNRKGALLVQMREKPHQSPWFPEKPHPHAYLLLRRGTKNTRFLANRHGPPLRTGRFGPVRPHLDRHRRC
ncbi:MAG: hypothetical protein LBE17_05040, partial [Treponema sp.]|nr:hypothetical protein [Treponema sp.]